MCSSKNISFFAEQYPKLQQLKRRAYKTQTQSHAEGTYNNLLVQWTCYKNFCLFYEMQLLPVLEENLVLYIQFLTEKLKSPSSIKNYVGAIRTLSQWVALSVQAFDSVRVKMMFRAINRTSTHVVKQAQPLTPKILIAIHNVIRHSDPEEVTFWAALLLSFMLMLRKSNIVPNTLNSFNAQKQLSRKNLLILPQVVWVDIFWSKTLQFRREGLKFPLLQIKGSQLCPVKAISNMYKLLPATPDSPCFIHKSGQPWTYSQYQRKLKQLLQRAGFDSSRFSSHSCRRGGASFCFAVGVPEFLIKAIGDWRSDSFRRYIDISLQTRAMACAMFRRALLNLK